MKKVIKVNFAALVALTMTFGMMSFRVIEKASSGTQTPLYWYRQVDENSWELESETPSVEPEEACREDEGSRCVKGFENQIPEESISDDTEADQEYFRLN